MEIETFEDCKPQDYLMNRAARNAQDPLDNSISHLQVATRVTNAIHLQFGLLNGTVPLDDVVGELLYSGIVKPKDLKGPVKEVLEDLKSLNINKEVETKKAETAYETLNEMKELVQEVKEIGKGLLDQAFEGDLKVLEANGFDLKVPEELEEAVNGFVSRIKDVRKYHGNGEDQKAVDTFRNLISEIDSLLSKAKELDADAIVQMPSAVASFAPILNQAKAVKLYADRKSQLETSTEGKEKLLGNLQEMSRASEEATKILRPLEAARSILEPRNPRRPLLTAGFPNGVDDLNLLFSQDPWFKELTDTEALYKHLAPISKFFDEIKKVSDGIAPLKPAPIDEILEFVKPFNISSIPKDFGTDQMFACIKTLPFGTTVTPFDVDPLSADIVAVDTGVEELRAAIRDMSSFLEKPQTISIINEMRDIALEATTADPNQLRATIEKFLDPEKIGAFEKVIEEFKKLNKKVDDEKVKGLAAKVSSQQKTLETFQKTLDNLKPAFECLQPLEDAKVVGQMIDTWKTMQVPKQETIKEVVKIMKTLDAMPASVVNEMKALDTGKLHLKDSELHSTTLGLATRGIADMRDLLKQEANFELIGGLPGKEGLQKTHTSLVAWKGGVKESKNLSGYGRIFEEALKVPGVERFEKIGEEVRDLEEKETDPTKKEELKKVVNATEELGAVGLDLAGYSAHFRNAPKSLEAMESFFASFKPRVTTTKEVGIVIGSTTTIGYSEDNAMLIIIVVIVVAAFISVAASAVAGFCYCCSWCCFKKKKRAVKENVKGGCRPPKTPLTTTSPVPTTTSTPATPLPPTDAPKKKVTEKPKTPSKKSETEEPPKKRAKKEDKEKSVSRSRSSTVSRVSTPALPALPVSYAEATNKFVIRVNLEVRKFVENKKLLADADEFFEYAKSLINNIRVTGDPREHIENRLVII
uniref:WSN domain-containing protein n=1 Tax=Caenorhabditis tropicalis TaxID=1561998 RepID=A0A1I7TLX5_9PELO